MHNGFCHLELQTNDLKGANKFYSELFDWELENVPMPPGGEYTLIKPGKGPMGGMMKNPADEAPPAWMVYITVENIEDKVKQAVELGATVIVEKMSVPDMGVFAILFDPQGACFAIWESQEK